jgi:hypothetical protein
MGIETPDISRTVAMVPWWAPIYVGIPISILAVLRRDRLLQTGLIALALAMFLAGQVANSAMQITLHSVIHRSPAR